MFIRALFITAPQWKEHNIHLAGESINKLLYISTILSDEEIQSADMCNNINHLKKTLY